MSIEAPQGNIIPLQRKDFVSDEAVRWCPGCGDYSILAQTQKVMPELGVPRENIVFISGIGCSGRLPSIAQHIRAGTVKGLGVTGSKRAQAFKDIPTIAESGYPGFVINPWFGLFAPKGTPLAIVRQINAEVNKILQDKDTMDKFAVLGAEPYETTPQEFTAILHADILKWATVVKSSGATAD